MENKIVYFILSRRDIRFSRLIYKTCSFLGILLLQSVLFFATYVYTFYIWMSKIGVWLLLQAYFVHCFCHLRDVFLTALIMNIAIAFKNRYEDLNKLLDFDLIAASHGVKIFNRNSITFFRKIGTLSRILSEMIESFNQIFGWLLIFTIGKTVSQILVCFDFVIGDLQIDDDYFKQHAFISKVLMAIITLVMKILIFVSAILIMLSCDCAMKESGRTVCLCYKLQERFPHKSDERDEILNLAKQVKINSAKITAADFFEINKSTLLSILATTTTYFI
ncbi:7tm 7 domain containing protein, partial [Asbolus verrucosus]